MEPFRRQRMAKPGEALRHQLRAEECVILSAPAAVAETEGGWRAHPEAEHGRPEQGRPSEEALGGCRLRRDGHLAELLVGAPGGWVAPVVAWGLQGEADSAEAVFREYLEQSRDYFYNVLFFMPNVNYFLIILFRLNFPK